MDKLKAWWNNPLFRFVTYAFILYISWFYVYDNWLHPLGNVDRWVIEQITTHSSILLDVLGFQLQPNDLYGDQYRIVGINDSVGVWIGDECNGLTLFALFTGFVLAFPGPIKTKMWFIPVGIITIHLLNVLRVSALAIISKFSPESLDFNHTYTFTTIVYSYVFLLWYWWANKLSSFGKKD
ncbi:MAG: exosortase X [Salibacteraceae bacterium]